MTPGPIQIIIILVLILLVFGAGRLPSIAENLAKGITSFKKGLRDGDDDETKSIDKKED
ncbi:MAG: twin-arginine translocase TatA/TatE family subunit [Micavibrio sp.]|nr:twin-arginine translocase TatA/TatE family subunit [Micavibrio sp.]